MKSYVISPRKTFSINIALNTSRWTCWSSPFYCDKHCNFIFAEISLSLPHFKLKFIIEKFVWLVASVVSLCHSLISKNSLQLQTFKLVCIKNWYRKKKHPENLFPLHFACNQFEKLIQVSNKCFEVARRNSAFSPSFFYFFLGSLSEQGKNGEKFSFSL